MGLAYSTGNPLCVYSGSSNRFQQETTLLLSSLHNSVLFFFFCDSAASQFLYYRSNTELNGIAAGTNRRCCLGTLHKSPGESATGSM